MSNPYQPPQSQITVSSVPRKFDVKYLLFSFDGRIPRRMYWAATGIMWAVMIVPAILVVALESTAANLIFFLLMLPLVYCGFAVGAKRWHDRNKSGWWNLISLIPYIGGIWQLIECGCLRGTFGPNNYGDDPT